MKRDETDHPFDILPGDEMPPQEEVRPEPPAETVREVADFLARMESFFGPARRPSKPITGDRFLL